VVTDEVYEHMALDGDHIPLATFPGMAERTLTISSAGKTFSVTGWKVGWASGPVRLVRAASTAKQFLSFAGGAPFQPGVLAGLELPDTYFAGLAADLRTKRDFLCDGLAAAGFAVFRPRGTYFVTTDVRSLGYDDGLAFCRELPHRAGVVAIPCSVFYDDPAAGRSLVRFTFCKQPAVLAEGVDRLARAFASPASGSLA
jgi:N-succinyldiaminopimelate aminotransferase